MLLDKLFSQYLSVEWSQTQQWGPHCKYDYFGGHGQKNVWEPLAYWARDGYTLEDL